MKTVANSGQIGRLVEARCYLPLAAHARFFAAAADVEDKGLDWESQTSIVGQRLAGPLLLIFDKAPGRIAPLGRSERKC